ncbi:MAG: hypothetical protein H7A37_01720 [Chlamydiales bacterium]|nr:hypothetical protein [Chlamydiia bacterium]MCP5507007.1 hypothetical protein [Chlamydiales bacterium]
MTGNVENTGGGNVGGNFDSASPGLSEFVYTEGEVTVSGAITTESFESKIVRTGEDGTLTTLTMRYYYSGNSPEALENAEAGAPVLTSSFVVQSADGTVAASGTGNAFLQPNMMVQVTENMMKMVRMLMESKMVELGERLTAMTMVWELALSASRNVMETAQMKAEQHMALAFSAGVSAMANLGLGIALGGFAAFGSKGQRAVVQASGTSFSHSMNSASQVVENVIQAHYALLIGDLEAHQKLIEGLQQLQQQNMQSAFQANDDLNKLLEETLQALRSAIQAHSQAYQSLTGSGG